MDSPRSATVPRDSTEEQNSHPAAGPLFVVGVPRSGTTLLYALLNQHPQIALLHEGDLPLLWPLFLKRQSKSRWLERWNFWNQGLERHQIDVTRIPTDVSNAKSATQMVCREYARKKGATIWGDKSPGSHGSLDRLMVQFPNARFVIIWRDPADVCRSIIRAGEDSRRFRRRGAVHRALMGYSRLKIGRDRLLHSGIRVHEIQYQDLVRDPTEEMMKICRFLGISFDGKMGSLHGADRSAVPPVGHNDLVKGENIVSSRQQPEALPINLKRKIERYEVFWREKYDDWPIFHPSQQMNVRKPRLMERVYDQLFYRLLRGWDLAVVFIYCFAPIGLLKAYRALSAGESPVPWPLGRLGRQNPYRDGRRGSPLS
jgi:Sulfotransferase family